ncbi:flagellar basal body rod protein FlgB [Schnuerera sp. xch1]|uniref:flagellar basal body rod protein FlgB n=1 Tax=Schnuerera sp. xch1 TaxID=2874283 RepID=UPI001CBBE875|nr:flagellar basal body rod protein FlgB [Schnuerera sp. xch1]MBZ2173882.1 flagellar basal body rod protein FlgB [Schnuerera sp. xch1]
MLNNFNGSIDILNKALNGLWLRDKAINQNISNANTPNYKRLTVSFEDSLREAITNSESKLVVTHEDHFPVSNSQSEVVPSLHVDKGYSYRFDKNNVNIDVESANLAKNSIMYNAVVNQLIGEFDKIKNVINEGSR